MNLKCLFGSHDFYAIYKPLILAQEGKVRVADNQLIESKNLQYITVKRICFHCKKKEEYIIQLAEQLQDWDVLLHAPNFVSETWGVPLK